MDIVNLFHVFVEDQLDGKSAALYLLALKLDQYLKHFWKNLEQKMYKSSSLTNLFSVHLVAQFHLITSFYSVKNKFIS